MKTDTQTFRAAGLLAQLALVAPSICIETLWAHDDGAKWEKEWTAAGLDRAAMQAWESEVKASAIYAGRLVSGSAYLGGTWEKFGVHPSKCNPEISGYLPQMIEEALQELLSALPESGTLDQTALRAQIGEALAII